MNRKQRRAQVRPGGAGRAEPGASQAIAGWLEAALTYQRAGRPQEAERVCRQILAAHPGQAQTLHLLGLIDHQLGRIDEAIEHIRAAIARDGRDPAFHHNLGNVLAAAGRISEAMSAWEKALALAPNSVDTLYNLGNACHGQGQARRAVDYFERALRLRPDAIELYNDLAAALHDVGRLDEAVACYRKALTLRPNSVELLGNLASALQAQGRLEEAQACCERALALAPDRVETHIVLGDILRTRGLFEAAVQRGEQALGLVPDHPAAHNNIGVALVELGRAPEAEQQYRRALMVAPDLAETHNNLGIALEHQGRFAEALDCYRRALALRPDYAEAHFNRAHALLVTGQFAEGWQEFEWRFAVGRYDRKFEQPLWAGEPLAGRRILLHAEQGLGDALQFVRYAGVAAERGGRVVLEVPRALVRLAGTAAGGTEVIAAGDRLPQFDCHCPLLSLPRVLGTTIATIPDAVPYLTAEPERVRFWRERLPDARFRIGIAWQGNPEARMDKARSLPLREFAPLAAVPGVSLVSLQKGHGTDQLAALPTGMRIAVLGDDFDAGCDAFLDTAAVMMSLDLVIACDTSVAHLAGALARPTWLLLPHYPDWRWLVGCDNTPWYPTFRLFRQLRPGDWASVMRDAAAALARLAG